MGNPATISRRTLLGAAGSAVLAPYLAAGCSSPATDSPGAASPGSTVDGRTRIAVLGGGVAGLAAGITLLDEGGSDRFDVTMITMGHKLGGKLSGWRDQDGYRAWHGLHVIYGFYTELPRLLREAGVDLDEALVPNDGLLYWYEDWNQRVNEMNVYPDPADTARDFAAYEGFTLEDRADIAAFSARHATTLLVDEDIEHLDEISFTQWCREGGLNESVLASSWFRYLRDVAFNYPFEISAYIAILSLRFIGGFGGADYERSMNYIPNGGWGDTVIAPLEARFESLGGKIAFKSKVTHLHHDSERMTGIDVATPDPIAEHCPAGILPSQIAVDENTTSARYDFDAYVCTLPFDNLRELNTDDDEFWGHDSFAAIAGLRSVVSMAYHLYLREPVGLENYPTFINGLPEPMPFVIDLKGLVDDYRTDDELGAVLDFVGQENGIEELSDDEIKTLALDNLVAAGFRDPREAGILHSSFRRNHSNHSRYLLTEPGHLKHRPGIDTPYSNFYLAGDWVRHEIEMPTLEGAVRSGIAAARRLI